MEEAEAKNRSKRSWRRRESAVDKEEQGYEAEAKAKKREVKWTREKNK